MAINSDNRFRKTCTRHCLWILAANELIILMISFSPISLKDFSLCFLVGFAGRGFVEAVVLLLSALGSSRLRGPLCFCKITEVVSGAFLRGNRLAWGERRRLMISLE